MILKGVRHCALEDMKMTLSRLMTFNTTTITDGRPVTTFYTQVVTVTLTDYAPCGNVGCGNYYFYGTSNIRVGANCADYTMPSTAVDFIFDDTASSGVRPPAFSTPDCFLRCHVP